MQPIELSIGLPEGTQIGFFVIPNGTLAQAQAGESRQPLFTVPELNPGGFVQSLAFFNPEAEQSDSSTGEGVIITMEDLAIQLSSDRDFADVVFEITKIRPVTNEITCSE